MKRKYKNIKIPYSYYDKVKGWCYYVYNNKYYNNIYDAVKDYLGCELTYHFLYNNKLIRVHDLEKISEYILLKGNFSIPDEYKYEYSLIEYQELNWLYKNINKYEFKAYYYQKPSLKYLLEEPISCYLGYKYYKLYKNCNYPKKVYSKFLKTEVFVYKGHIYYTINDILELNYYYEFNNPLDSGYQLHEHEFNFVINEVFHYFNEFKINKKQEQFYSKQELVFLDKLVKKLKDDKFDNSILKIKDSYEEWKYLHDNHKYFKLLIYNIKDYFSNKKKNKEILKMYKKQLDNNKIKTDKMK